MIIRIIPIFLVILIAACGSQSAEDAARGACGVTASVPLTVAPIPWSDGALEFRFANGTFVKVIEVDGEWTVMDRCQT